MTGKELRELRAEAAAAIKKLADSVNDEKRDFTGDEQENWDKANATYDDLSRQIDRADRVEVVTKDQEERSDKQAKRSRDDAGAKHGGGEATEEDRSLALQGWCMRQAGLEPAERHVEAAQRCGVNINARHYDFKLREDYRSMRREARAQSTTAGAGGETIPEGFVNNFELALLAFGSMRTVSDIMRTPTGNDLPWPHSNDTSNKGAIIAENAAVAEQDVTTGALVFNAYKYTSNLIRVSAEILEDSAFNFANVLGAMLGERIARILEQHFTTGTGTAQPKGIVTAATQGKVAASGTAITADELIDLMHSIDPAYRGPGAGWMFSDGVAKVLRKLKDANNQYIWQPGMVAGQPDVLFGFPTHINQEMVQTPAVNAKTVVFGMLNKYKIRDVANVRIRRLVERYADFDQEGFMAISRHDGDLLDAGTNPVKYLQQAAV